MRGTSHRCSASEGIGQGTRYHSHSLENDCTNYILKLEKDTLKDHKHQVRRNERAMRSVLTMKL